MNLMNTRNVSLIISKVMHIFKSRIFKLTFSAALLILVFYSTDVSAVISQLQSIPALSSLLFIMLVIAVIFMTSVRWQLLLTNRLSLDHMFHFFAANMMGSFYSLFLPSVNGGDLVKWTLLPKLQNSRKHVLFSIAHDRIVGICGLILIGFICGLIGYFFLGARFSSHMILTMFILLVASCGALLFLLIPNLFQKIPFLKNQRGLSAVIELLIERKKVTIIGVGITLLSQLFFFTAIWIVSLPLGFSLELWQIVLFGSVAYMFASLPISFSGIGTTELSFLYFFEPLGVERNEILALTTSLLLYKIILALIGWVVGSFAHTIRHSSTTSE